MTGGAPGLSPSKPPRAFVSERIDPTEASLDRLRGQGVDVAVGGAMREPGHRRYSEDAIIAAAQGLEAVMGSGGATFSRRLIAALPALRFISKFGIGYDAIDLAAATERGIRVSNTPDKVDAMAVSEHAITCILALKKQLTVWTPDYMRRGGWRAGDFSGLLRGATLGIVGFGTIGRGVAQRLTGWDMRILAYGPHLREAPDHVTVVSLETLLAEADIVTLHARATQANRHMIGRAALARMKRGSLLVNTGGGSLVDQAALREALASGHLGGAALDVFEVEPPDPDDPLFAMRNVVVTPHVAGWTYEGLQSVGRHGARNLWAMLSGEGHADVVNPQARAAPRVTEEASR
jgi:D-3-phosphoglycerate dehydrogenase